MSLAFGENIIAGLALNGSAVSACYNGQIVWPDALPVYNLMVLHDEYGSASAEPTTGYSGDTAQLYSDASAGYEFSGWSVTGGTIAGDVFTWGNSDATVSAAFKQAEITVPVWIVGSPSATAHGYVYSGSTLLTSWSSIGSASASAPIGTTFKISSVASSYCRNNFATPTGMSNTAFVATKTKNQTASGVVTASAVWQVNPFAAAFTAYGSFPYGSNTAEQKRRFGRWMPHRITSLSVNNYINASDVSASYAAQIAYAENTSNWSYYTTGAGARFKTGVAFNMFSAHGSVTAQKNNTYDPQTVRLRVSNVASGAATQAAAATSTTLAMNVNRANTAASTTGLSQNLLTMYHGPNEFYCWWTNALFTATGRVP